MEIIERSEQWRERYNSWGSKQSGAIESLKAYPFVENSRAPFTPARRAITMTNLAVIVSAGAYLDGTDPFDINASRGDFQVREIPTDIDLQDLRFAARGYDPSSVQHDVNVQVPLERLREFVINRVIGQMAPAFWSFSGFVPDAGGFVEQTVPQLIERLTRYDVQAALLIPASQLCHQ